MNEVDIKRGDKVIRDPPHDKVIRWIIARSGGDVVFFKNPDTDPLIGLIVIRDPC